MSHITDANKWREEPLKDNFVQIFRDITSLEINVLDVQFIIAMNM